MSFPKKDRKFQPRSGKTFPNTHTHQHVVDGHAYAIAIADALHRAFGGTHAAVKSVAILTGANERTVKNWFGAKNGPNGQHLIQLAHHSDEVLEVILKLADRAELLTTKMLVDSREKLIEMMDIIDSLRNDGRGEDIGKR